MKWTKISIPYNALSRHKEQWCLSALPVLKIHLPVVLLRRENFATVEPFDKLSKMVELLATLVFLMYGYNNNHYLR